MSSSRGVGGAVWCSPSWVGSTLGVGVSRVESVMTHGPDSYELNPLVVVSVLRLSDRGFTTTELVIVVDAGFIDVSLSSSTTPYVFSSMIAKTPHCCSLSPAVPFSAIPPLFPPAVSHVSPSIWCFPMSSSLKWTTGAGEWLPWRMVRRSEALRRLTATSTGFGDSSTFIPSTTSPPSSLSLPWCSRIVPSWSELWNELDSTLTEPTIDDGDLAGDDSMKNETRGLDPWHDCELAVSHVESGVDRLCAFDASLPKLVVLSSISRSSSRASLSSSSSSSITGHSSPRRCFTASHPSSCRMLTPRFVDAIRPRTLYAVLKQRSVRRDGAIVI